MDHQETEERGEIEMPLYFGVFVSLFAYLIGMELKKKFGWPVLNPLLVAIILVIAFLKATGITYTDYNEGASYISYFLTPATVCLAIPLYKQLELLKRNLTAVATAITAGVIGSVVSVYVMSMIFKLEHVHYVSLLPKSITTAIGMGVSEEAGGIVTMTIVSIIITGILGNIVADGWFKLIGSGRCHEQPVYRGSRTYDGCERADHVGIDLIVRRIFIAVLVRPINGEMCPECMNLRKCVSCCMWLCGANQCIRAHSFTYEIYQH